MHPNSEGGLWPFARGSEVTIGIATLIWLTAVWLWLRLSNLIAGIYLLTTTSLWLIVLYFFRDPDRPVTGEPGLVVGPGDGRIVEISREREDEYLQGEAIRISIFLSLTNVHVQRAPTGGTVRRIQHKPGKFLQAFRAEASQLNENIAMCIETPYGPVLIKQIAGILARRCVNYMSPGDQLQTGQRFGLIRFGSRLDLFLPPNARLLAKTGDRVVGGVTPIARLQHHPLS